MVIHRNLTANFCGQLKLIADLCSQTQGGGAGAGAEGGVNGARTPKTEIGMGAMTQTCYRSYHKIIKWLHLLLHMLDQIVLATNPSMSLHLVCGMPSLETSRRKNHCSKRCWSLTFIQNTELLVFIFTMFFTFALWSRWKGTFLMFICIYIYVLGTYPPLLLSYVTALPCM